MPPEPCLSSTRRQRSTVTWCRTGTCSGDALLTAYRYILHVSA
jgi:hypothetical protein